MKLADRPVYMLRTPVVRMVCRSVLNMVVFEPDATAGVVCIRLMEWNVFRPGSAHNSAVGHMMTHTFVKSNGCVKVAATEDIRGSAIRGRSQ